MTTESGEKRSITLSRMHFYGYVGHVAIFSWRLTIGAVY